MTLIELHCLISKQKRKDERLKAAQRIALVIVGVTAVSLTVLGVSTGILFATKFGKKVRVNMKNKAIKTVRDINDAIQNEADKVKDSAKHISHDMRDAIENVDAKTESLKKDIKDGYTKVVHDFNDTAEDISNEFKK